MRPRGRRALGGLALGLALPLVVGALAYGAAALLLLALTRGRLGEGSALPRA